jgi:hypothetical protein
MNTPNPADGEKPVTQPIFTIRAAVDHRGDLADTQNRFYDFLENQPEATTREDLHVSRKNRPRDEVRIYPNGVVTVVMANDKGLIQDDPSAHSLNAKFEPVSRDDVGPSAHSAGDSSRHYDYCNGIYHPDDPYTHRQFFAVDLGLKSYGFKFASNGAVVLLGRANTWDPLNKVTTVEADADGNGKAETITVFDPNTPTGRQIIAVVEKDGVSATDNTKKYGYDTYYIDRNGDGTEDQVTIEYRKSGRHAGKIRSETVVYRRPQTDDHASRSGA